MAPVSLLDQEPLYHPGRFILGGLLLAASGNWIGIAVYLVVAATISAVALYLTQEARGLDYAELDREQEVSVDESLTTPVTSERRVPNPSK